MTEEYQALRGPDDLSLSSPGPARIRLSRKKGYRKPTGSIVVSRPSRYGNPWKAAPGVTSASLVAIYRHELINVMEGRIDFSYMPHLALAAAIDRFPELRGHDLACWCPLDEPCHADVLLEMANA